MPQAPSIPSPGCEAMWKPPGREERLISVGGWVTVGLLHVGYCFCILENDHPGRPFCFWGYAASWWEAGRDAFALDSAVAARAQFTCLAATNHSHQSPPGSGTRCLCFQQFYSNLVIFSDFGKFISEEGLAPTYLKVKVASKNNSMNKKKKWALKSQRW